MMLNKSILLFLLVLASKSMTAQNFRCGFDLVRDENPDQRVQEETFNQEVRRYLKGASGTAKSTLTIPVVVHIVHQNGPENIGDASVVSALDELNERLANSGTFYDASGNDAGISVCLASVDQFGNPTTGITHTVSSYTVLGSSQQATDLNMKNLDRWEPNLYLNVWVVKDISAIMPGHSGYSSFPSSAGNGWDGIVIQYNWFNSTILAHELGHYLGLYHTFEGGCTNYNCELDGDLVCDTPPDASDDYVCPDNSCATETNDTTGLSPFTGDEMDLPNYMDYTSCYTSFSLGQVARMNATLSTVRSSLLQSNGCGQYPGGAIPQASFTVGVHNCYSYPFTNTSGNSVGAQWDFNSDGIIDQAGNSVSYAFPSTGTYTVTMYASGYGGVSSTSQQVFAQVVPYQNYPMVNGYSGVVLSGSDHFNFCPGATVEFNGVAGMASYQWSTGQTTQNLVFQPDTAFSVSLTAVDMNGLVWTSCYPIIVEEVPPPQLSILAEDTIYCEGDEVTIHVDFGYYMTSNEWYDNDGLISGFHGTDYTVTLESSNLFLVQQHESTGCSTWSDTLLIVPDPLACSSAGLLNNEAGEFELYPNPAADRVTVRWLEGGRAEIFLYQSDGKLLDAFSPVTESMAELDLSNLATGIYLIRLQREDASSATKYLIVE